MEEILMTKEQIKEVIPHREPILMIDEILEMVPGESIKARLYLDPAENYFKGHFPGEPGDTIIIEAKIEEEYPEKAIAICSAAVYNDGRKSAVGKVTLAMR